jgi:hypothetical protein
MIGFIIFLVISIGFWLYTTKIDKEFYPRLQKKLTEFINGIVKNINPLSDNLFNNNVPLMKTNLFMMTFNKNIDLYNIIYNSSTFKFLITNDDLRNITLSDFDMLIPSTIGLTDDMVQTKANLTKVSSTGFSKFFLDLTNNGVYLLDYWDIFYEFMKPLLIVNSSLTITEKVSKLNTLHSTFTIYDAAKVDKINSNIDNIILVIYECILRLSNITINYKQLIDLDTSFTNPTTTINAEEYNTKKTNIINNINITRTQLNTYLSTNSFEFSFISSYLTKVIGTEKEFINSQFNTNYIILYRMFSQIDGYNIYYQGLDINILDIASNANI